MLALLALLPFLLLCGACSVNITIDDTYGDERTGSRPQYSPPDAWYLLMNTPYGNEEVDIGKFHFDLRVSFSNSIFVGDITLTFNGRPWPFERWQFVDSFSGTMIYVYGGISADRVADFVFILDSELRPGAWQNTSDDGVDPSSWLYDQLVFQSPLLPQGQHTLKAETNRHWRVCFDYAIYTVEEADNSDSSTRTDTAPQETVESSTGRGRRPIDAKAVAGATTAVVAVVIAIGAWFCIRRRRRRTRRSGQPAPFVAHSSLELVAPAEKSDTSWWSDANKAAIAPFTLQPDAAPAPQKAKDDKMRWEAMFGPSDSSASRVHVESANMGVMAAIRAELERVREENTRAHTESERTRAAYEREIERLRQAVEPPPY
ncbi:hypothetical protein AURDEDRAFT_164387 [Auricularia subglabra TFB-10046 SS5]|nr:hypothetical protein AURDEDRAFT_164387 [Auricularia subglabra TFB-10046 SS5]